MFNIELVSPIFIVGCPRSGTTLLQCMLAAHPETFSLPETHFFCTVLPEAAKHPNRSLSLNQFSEASDLLQKKMNFQFSSSQQKELARLIDGGILTPKMLFQYLIYCHQPDHPSLLRLIEKTPYHVFYLDLLAGLFPEARFVHLVRDARAVISSRLSMPSSPHQSVKKYAADWNRCISAAQNFQNCSPKKMISVRYEDLINHPSDQLKIICSFLSLDYQEGMLRDFSHQYDSCTLPNEHSWKNKVQKGNILDRSNNWRKKLSTEQIEEIDSICEGFLHSMEYNNPQENHMTTKQTFSSARKTQIQEICSQRLESYRNRHKGERCVIIGNGPSLREMDLSPLEDEFTFGLNRIYLGFENWDFRPDYYVSVNSLVLEQHAEEILEHIQAPKFISYHGLPYFPKDREDVIFLKSLPDPIFSKEPGQGVWEGYTVTYVAMQLAFFMGFEEVVLIGVDHNFVTKGPANTEVVSQGDDPNHFAKDYFGKGARWHLPDLHNSEMAYRLAKQVFENHHRRILDATVGGKLTVFPKVFFDKHLEQRDKSTKSIDDQGMSQRDKPLMSLILPAGENRSDLETCLRQLGSQTMAEKLEVIIIEQGVNQPRHQLPEPLLDSFAAVTHTSLEGENPSDAWNLGALRAAGEFILMIKPQDQLQNQALEFLSEALLAHPEADLVYADFAPTSDPDQSLETISRQDTVETPLYKKDLALMVPIFGPHAVYRKSVLEYVGLFNNKYHSQGEFDYQLRLTAAGALAVKIPLPLSLAYQPATGDPHNELPRIRKQKRSQIPLEAIFNYDSGSLEGEAAAWTALGNRAVKYDHPSTQQEESDLGFAIDCFQKALKCTPVYYPALHNLIVLLGSLGQWREARQLLQSTDVPPTEELFQAVSVQRLVPLIPVSASLKPGCLEYLPDDHPELDQAHITLQKILDADDILSALEDNRERLDHAVLNLVQETIIDARSSGQEELAQGLGNLADHLAAVLQAG